MRFLSRSGLVIAASVVGACGGRALTSGSSGGDGFGPAQGSAESSGAASASGSTSSAPSNGDTSNTNGSTAGRLPLGAGFHMANWPMPNPPSTKLPHPQHYMAGPSPGVVIDAVTGLAWQASPSPTEVDYPTAVAYCAALTDAGGGWRLPSRIELISIMDYTTLAGVDVAWFNVTTTASGTFWSQSALVGASTAATWVVSFGEAQTALASAYQVGDGFGSFGARCVRGGAPDPAGGRYQTSGDVVVDVATGLAWQQTPSAATVTQDVAAMTCAALTTGGGGWRLPSIGELETLVDDTRANPSIDTSAFPGTASFAYWSQSVDPRVVAFFYTAQFDFGGAKPENSAAQPSYLRCVKAQ